MNTIGALVSLALAIVLIVQKASPTYSLILGDFIGGILGGFLVPETVTVMIDGVKDITSAIFQSKILIGLILTICSVAMYLVNGTVYKSNLKMILISYR